MLMYWLKMLQLMHLNFFSNISKNLNLSGIKSDSYKINFILTMVTIRFLYLIIEDFKSILESKDSEIFTLRDLFIYVLLIYLKAVN